MKRNARLLTLLLFPIGIALFLVGWVLNCTGSKVKNNMKTMVAQKEDIGLQFEVPAAEEQYVKAHA